ncbi:MAG: hypothetical protein WBB07_00250 [Mycobacterium sp.]
MSSRNPTPDDDLGEQLFAWAIVAPVLTKHYSVMVPADQDVAVCACSPTTRRTIEQWARHVCDEIARSVV